MSPSRRVGVAVRKIVLAVVVVSLVVGQRPTAADDVEHRIADFWRRVDALAPTDHLAAADLGQWALNVIGRDPRAAIRVSAFRASTAGMQVGIERAGPASGPSAPPTANVEQRIATFWQRVDALAPTDLLHASDLGQWALNVIERDPRARIRVDDFRGSTAEMQSAFDAAAAAPPSRAPTAAASEPDTYFEDFADGWADEWELSGGALVEEGAMVPQGPARGRYRFGEYWRDSTLRVRYTHVAGELRLHYRVKWQQIDRGYVIRGYEIAIAAEQISLSRLEDSVFGRNAVRLGSAPLGAASGPRSVEVTGQGAHLLVRVDTQEVLAVDDGDPAAFLEGSVGFEVPEGGHALIDEIEVRAMLHAEQTWSRTNGPAGALITTISVDPTNPATVYAGTAHSGLYISRDRGLRWRQVGYAGGIVKTKVACVEVAPSDPQLVYLCHLEGGGASRTTDGGAHWSAVRPGQFGHVNSFAIHPNDTRTVYVGIGSSESPQHSTAEDGVYLTRDGGTTWEALSIGNRSIFALRISRSRPTTVYAVGAGGVWRSDDAGATWTAASGGLGQVLFTQLAVDPQDALIAYARQSSLYGPLFRTTDGGASWQQIRDGVEGWTLARDGVTLYASSGASIARSRDRGARWEELSGARLPASVDALATDPTQPERLYAGLRGHGIYLSQDAGTSWAPLQAHLLGGVSTAVAVHPTETDTVYAAHGHGDVSVTKDGGATWRALARLGIGSPQDQATAIVIRPDRPGTVFVANRTGVYRSDDAGATWQDSSSGLGDRRIISLAIDPRDPQHMYAGTGDSKQYFVYRGTGLYRSTNGGASWQRVPDIPAAPVPSIAVSAADGNLVYAAVMGRGIYRSADRGATWTAAAPLQNPYAYVIAAHPTQRDTIYAGTLQYYGRNNWDGSDALHKSVDGGRTWQRLRSDWVETLVIDPVRPENVYFSEHSERIWHSPDGGTTWRLASKGLVATGAHLYTYAMAIAASGSVLYMVNCGMGMYRNVLTQRER